MEGDDNILEEDYMLVSERDCKAGNNARKDIEKLSSAVEFMCFVNQGVEALVDGLSNHFPAGHQLDIKKRGRFRMKNLTVRHGSITRKTVHVI